MIGSVLQQIIRECRKKGLTQREISQITGVDRSTIAYMESGKHRDARFSTVIRVAQGLNLSLDEICEKEDLTPAPARKNLNLPPIHSLVGHVLSILEEYYPEESYPGCHLCLEGMCKHDAGIQFARMLREACHRLSRVRGWRISG
jgi:transcriptional regulator with XRE-family HTH domain